MKCLECQTASRGMMASQLIETIQHATLRRYRPINAHDDIVEFSGKAIDAILATLAAIVKASRA